MSVAGLVAFCWPLLVSPDSGLAHGTDAPLVFALVLPLLLAVVLAEMSEGGLDVKAVAILGVLAAIGAAPANEGDQLVIADTRDQVSALNAAIRDRRNGAGVPLGERTG